MMAMSEESMLNGRLWSCLNLREKMQMFLFRNYLKTKDYLFKLKIFLANLLKKYLEFLEEISQLSLFTNQFKFHKIFLLLEKELLISSITTLMLGINHS